MNSTVGPIFNEKVAEKCNLWVCKQYICALFTAKSQHLRLLFTALLQNKTREKKKKKKNKNAASETQRSRRGTKHTLNEN